MAQIRANNEYYETHGLVTSDGAPVTTQNPLPVTIGSDNITITGDVNIVDTVSVNSTPEDPVHNHITEVGTSGILTTDYLPIGGEVTLVDGNGDPYTVLNPVPVAQLPTPLGELYSFNNFATNVHRGWTLSDTLIPLLTVRTKSSANSTTSILSYSIISNGANSSVIGYVWLEDATITGTVPGWTTLNTEAEYRVYTDAYQSNTPNGFTGGIRRHSGADVGKVSGTGTDISSVLLTASPQNELTLCLVRLDSATKIDVWFSIDTGILEV
jgi:hypothetical protein